MAISLCYFILILQNAGLPLATPDDSEEHEEKDFKAKPIRLFSCVFSHSVRALAEGILWFLIKWR